jgi:hypothetical protein
MSENEPKRPARTAYRFQNPKAPGGFKLVVRAYSLKAARAYVASGGTAAHKALRYIGKGDPPLAEQAHWTGAVAYDDPPGGFDEWARRLVERTGKTLDELRAAYGDDLPMHFDDGVSVEYMAMDVDLGDAFDDIHEDGPPKLDRTPYRFLNPDQPGSFRLIVFAYTLSRARKYVAAGSTREHAFLRYVGKGRPPEGRREGWTIAVLRDKPLSPDRRVRKIKCKESAFQRWLYRLVELTGNALDDLFRYFIGDDLESYFRDGETVEDVADMLGEDEARAEHDAELFAQSLEEGSEP